MTFHFDAYAALQKVRDEGPPPAKAAKVANKSRNFSRLAALAGVDPENEKKTKPPRSDEDAYLDNLRALGQSTYGAMASELGWPPGRAWRAEQRLKLSGLIEWDQHGKASIVGGAS